MAVTSKLPLTAKPQNDKLHQKVINFCLMVSESHPVWLFKSCQNSVTDAFITLLWLINIKISLLLVHNLFETLAHWWFCHTFALLFLISHCKGSENFWNICTEKPEILPQLSIFNNKRSFTEENRNYPVRAHAEWGSKAQKPQMHRKLKQRQVVSHCRLDEYRRGDTRLESVCTSKAYRGFESPSLRKTSKAKAPANGAFFKSNEIKRFRVWMKRHGYFWVFLGKIHRK